MNRHGAEHVHRPARRGFSLVELLVVIAVIAILSALVFISARALRGGASTAATTGLLNSINQAVGTFKNDFGYLPPLISRIDPSAAGGGGPGPAAGGIITPELEAQKSGNNADALAAYKRVRYSSQFSLPAYLLGMGGLNGRPTPKGDGTANTAATDYPPNTTAVGTDKPNFKAAAEHDGVPGPGFRSPGPLRAWKKPGAQPSTLTHSPDLSGRVYGPYLDPAQLANSIELVEVAPAAARARIDGLDGASDIFMYRFIEASGEPIRYYRGWPTRDPASTPPDQPSVRRVPVELRGAESVRAEVGGTNTDQRPADSDALAMSSPYILLAANQNEKRRFVGQVSAQTPYETDLDELFDKAMPFVGVADPTFDPADLNADQGLIARRFYEFLDRAVKVGEP